MNVVRKITRKLIGVVIVLVLAYLATRYIHYGLGILIFGGGLLYVFRDPNAPAHDPNEPPVGPPGIGF